MNGVAFFDLDYTLLQASSSMGYVRAALRQGRLSWWVAGYIGGLMATRRLGFTEAHQRLILHIGQAGQANTAQFCETLVKTKLLPRLSPVGLSRVKWHQAQGHAVVLLSASLEEMVRPVADHVGMAYRATRLAAPNGHYNGELLGPACYEAGKIHWANHWCAENGVDLARLTSYFYSDSSADLPLLELVKHPIAVNPSRKLKKIATQRGWQILQW